MRLILFTLLGAVLLTSGTAQEIRETEEQVDALRKRIEVLRQRRESDLRSRDSLRAALRDAETAEAEVAGRLRRVQAQQRDVQGRSFELEQQTDRQRANIRDAFNAIDAEIRVAWMSGREEWLKLVLSLEDPATLGRQLVYQGYLVRSRTEAVARFRGEVERLSELVAELNIARAKLDELAAQHAAQLERKREARAERAATLSMIAGRVNAGDAALAGLSEDLQELEALLDQLIEARGSFGAGDTAFDRARGALDWPANGQITAEFGKPRAGGQLEWTGVLIEADAGSSVRSVYDGRVIYSGWLPGMGMLTVIDHGGGYLSLYGHNQDLACEVGERVSAGQVIGSVGDSGGQPVPALYFEIRKDGQPVNPTAWVPTR